MTISNKDCKRKLFNEINKMEPYERRNLARYLGILDY